MLYKGKRAAETSCKRKDIPSTKEKLFRNHFHLPKKKGAA